TTHVVNTRCAWAPAPTPGREQTELSPALQAWAPASTPGREQAESPKTHDFLTSCDRDFKTYSTPCI
ncbi:hypothetical protein A2U01_0117441, partial [Trifolium medium]|nr:hypothetical protein [Trifolium medium]